MALLPGLEFSVRAVTMPMQIRKSNTPSSLVLNGARKLSEDAPLGQVKPWTQLRREAHDAAVASRDSYKSGV